MTWDTDHIEIVFHKHWLFYASLTKQTTTLMNRKIAIQYKIFHACFYFCLLKIILDRIKPSGTTTSEFRKIY